MFQLPFNGVQPAAFVVNWESNPTPPTLLIATFMLGLGPMAWDTGKPGAVCCGLPVLTSVDLMKAGVLGMLLCWAILLRSAAAPVTIGDALEVPLKKLVYH